RRHRTMPPGMSSTRNRASEPLPTDTVRLVTRILEGYAANGVFRGFSLTTQTSAAAKYRIVWHYDLVLPLVFNVTKRTLQFAPLLTDIPSSSSMYRELRKFIELFHSKERPAYRRVDPARAQLRCSNRAGNVFVSIVMESNEFEYGTRKLIHAAN